MIRTTFLFLSLIVVAGSAAVQAAEDATTHTAPEDAPAPAHVSRLSRWLNLQTGTLAARYKDTKATGGPWIYQAQYQFVARGRFQFDKEARYYAGFRLSTGKVFPYSWNATGAGDGDLATNIYLKELFLAASPWKSLEIQFGGIGINRGESTEITSYSNNGYLMGERVTVSRPDKLFFDEISVTGAYIGDAAKPGVFQRVPRLGKMNYHQFLVSKKINGRVSVSADYTFQDGIETLRQALKLHLQHNRFMDSVLFENYQRVDYRPAWGCAVTLQKSPIRRLALSGGFVDVDRNFVNWNADKLGRGKRVFLTASYNFWREFSAMLFAGKAFSNDFPVINAARYDLVISYDFMKALKKAEIL